MVQIGAAAWLACSLFFECATEVVGMPISEVVGSRFNLPAFFFHEPTGFLPFEFSKIRAGGEPGLAAEEPVQCAW